MFNGRRRKQVQSEAAAENRRLEDAAPRLRVAAPQLKTLRLTFDEKRTGSGTSTLSYARPIVVASAPARFDIPCMEPRCDGRHDLTGPILDAIKRRLTTSSGESACNGQINDTMCERTLLYVCEASYSG